MKIAFVTTMEGAPWGGSEELWSRVAVSLAASGHQVIANVLQWPEEAPAVAALRAKGIAISTRPRASRRDRLLRKLRGEFAPSWLSREKPDLLIVSQGGNLDGAGWMQHAADAGVPYVSIAQMADENNWPTEEIVGPAAEAYRQARQCFFVSQGNLNVTEMQIACRLPQGSVVRNPVNIPDGQTLPLPWPTFDDGIFRLASVGRLAPATKGQDIIFQVLSLPKWRERPIQVTLFGDGYFRIPMERQVKMLELSNVTFAGHVSRTEEIWRSHHALLMPSRYEGLPLSLVEAMLYGRFGIVSDVAGNAELIEDNVTGYIAAAPKATCLDEAMERAWQKREHWAQIGQRAAAEMDRLLPKDPIADFIHRLNLPSAAPLSTKTPSVSLLY